MEFLGHTLQVIGGVLIGLAAILVDRKLMKEKRLDSAVFKDIYKEQIFGILGIAMLIIGYFLIVI